MSKETLFCVKICTKKINKRINRRTLFTQYGLSIDENSVRDPEVTHRKFPVLRRENRSTVTTFDSFLGRPPPEYGRGKDPRRTRR